ncbi:hypothetical protein BSL78_30123 [Apostichopus japonicus]|uniref:Uncharacterized protein n=1 Tax=Stichopus japonicus TaxID=307972 RepID=A0A2G8JBE6_STIJA|nr:hypothetical protein BSL78_30123 [Apostichopus japonicus]
MHKNLLIIICWNCNALAGPSRRFVGHVGNDGRGPRRPRRSYNVGEDVDEADLEAELEALGDDMFAEDDSSYLDEPINAPAAPETAPGGESMKDGVLVDEFGLPQLPAS